MPRYFGRPPQRGSVDWAAERIRTMLDEDELAEAEFGRLQRSGWTPPASSLADAELKTGDPVADFVRPDLLRSEAMRDEARRRARQQLAQAPLIEGGAAIVPPRKPTLPAQPQSVVDPDDQRAYRFIDEIIDRWEGGFSDRPTDPGGRTSFGIRQDTLNDWNRAHRNSPDPMPADVRHLARDQARRILKENYYNFYGLGEIADESLAHQIMDVYTNTGTNGVRQIIQGATDEVMSDRGLYNRHEQPFTITDPVGPRSRSRLNWLVERGYGTELRNALVHHRDGFARTLPAFPEQPGWIPRIWRFWDPRSVTRY